MKANEYSPTRGFPQVSTKETVPSLLAQEIKGQERRWREWLKFQPPADSDESRQSSLQRSSCDNPEVQLCRSWEVVRDLALVLVLAFDDKGT